MHNAIEYIHNFSWKESRLGLSRIEALLEAMGNPQKDLNFIHVAGTNGKGSVCAITASILQAAGYQTGLYTSPFIHCFHERIQVNSNAITDSHLEEITQYVSRFADAMPDHPTEFEITTAIAFEYYKRQRCDFVVLEVGLGGRLDATNVIQTPVVAAITAMGLDHREQLGNTIKMIAAEKAGIIKAGGDVVLYPTDLADPVQIEAQAVIKEFCQMQSATVTSVDLNRLQMVSNKIEGQQFHFKPYTNLFLPLLGLHQQSNAATAITIVERLRQKQFKIADNAIYEGLKSVLWPARFERIASDPDFILDGGHNPQGVQMLADNLAFYYPGQQFVLLIGVMADKEYETMFLPVLELASDIITITPDNPRALPSEALAKTFKDRGYRSVHATNDAGQGVAHALLIANGRTICALGSLYMAGDIRRHVSQ